MRVKAMRALFEGGRIEAGEKFECPEERVAALGSSVEPVEPEKEEEPEKTEPEKTEPEKTEPEKTEKGKQKAK